MKLRFESNLPHQIAAIESVCDLFRGQEVCRSEFSVVRPTGDQLGVAGTTIDLGIGNRLQLLDSDLLKNLNEVQLRNGLKPTGSLDMSDLQFTVEMETGTGKTYVFLRTMFELHRRYGFSKFIVVVPSIAIREGVAKTIEITRDHFGALFGNPVFNSFVYDSSNLGQVRNFATSQHLELMVMTVGSITSKSMARIYKDHESLGGDKPIDLIRETRPIIIVDEPQSVLGERGKGAGAAGIREMDPLCTIGYSATHRDPKAMVYRLDAVDAYERKLVKQIEVASATVEGAMNRPYVKFLGLKRRRREIVAEVEVSVQRKSDVKNQKVVIHHANTDLVELTGRAIYDGWRVESFEQTTNGEQKLWLSNHHEPLHPGDSIGGVDQDQLDRLLISETIRHHLDRELRLRPKGIKVLSLFFINEVKDYRIYGEDGTVQKGRLAAIFEEQYERLTKHPKYATLFKEVDLAHSASEVHDGYFAMDRQNRAVDVREGERTAGERANSQRAYELIMRDKEKLLDLRTPLKFIFSHSALREGWDNPNVFQICALREIQSEQKRRQTIGRGLRLAVDQSGERVQGFEVNTLTVVANESYEAFAEALQQEIEEETGIRFGFVEDHAFANISLPDDGGDEQVIGYERSKELWSALRSKGLIGADGRVTDDLRRALRDDTLELPDGFEDQAVAIKARLRRLAGRLDIKDAGARQPIQVKRAVLEGREFQELWARIRHKTTYRVAFDNERLLADCIRAVNEMPRVDELRLTMQTAVLKMDEGGVAAEERTPAAPVRIDEADIVLPDLLTLLEERVKLTRQSLVRILVDSGRLDDFAKNPQQFLDLAAQAINTAKQHAIIDGIRYVRLGEQEVWAQEMFESDELSGYLKDTLEVQKSVHSHVRFDSSIEEEFAQKLDANPEVKVFAKLPAKFKVPTPLGSYTPDWAVLVERNGEERLYFVVETKGTDLLGELRRSEADKIRCGQAHFEALAQRDNPVEYMVTDSYEKFASRLAK